MTGSFFVIKIGNIFSNKLENKGAKMANKEHHVVPNKDKGGWDIKKSGSERSSKHCDTKDEAVKTARKMSQDQGTELVVHNKDGKIALKDSHGKDPCPPKDKQ